MRLFILTTEIYPYPGGIAQYIKNYSEAMAEAGHDVVVFGPSYESLTIMFSIWKGELPPMIKKNKIQVIRGVSIVDVEPHKIYNHSYLYKSMGYQIGLCYHIVEVVMSYMENYGKPDIIEVQECCAIGYHLIESKLKLNSQLSGVPIVTHLHSPYSVILNINGSPGFRISQWKISQLEKFCIISSDGVVCPSNFILNDTRRRLKVDIKTNVEVIPYPLDRILAADLKQFTPLPTPRDIVYFGRYEVRKGVVELLRECQQLWDSGVDFRLTLIGNSTFYPLRNCEMKDFIINRYRKYIDQGLLVLEPAMQKPALYERIAKAWCVVIPSLWENFPNVCMEAMLLQKVVLASRNGGMQEMIHYTDKPAGFVFDWDVPGDFANKLQQVLNLSEQENLSIGQNARDAVLHMCAPERIIPLRIEHFQRVIESTQATSRRIYPSLNYKPTGQIDYPPKLEPVGVPGRLSVCIPYYNMGRYIRETLDSVYQVNYHDLEVIIWDDGSTDVESLQVLTQVEKEYPGLKVYWGKNQGLAGARNSLAQVATGEFLAFLDADDKIHPDYYPKAVQILQNYDNVGMVATWIQNIENVEHKQIIWDGEFPFLLCKNQFGSAVVIKRSVYLYLGGVKADLSQVDGMGEWELWINMHRQGWLGLVVPNFYHFSRTDFSRPFYKVSREVWLRYQEQLVSYHREIYQAYGNEIFSLCHQNEISPLYWYSPTQDYSLPNMQTDGSGLGKDAKILTLYPLESLVRAMLWKILRKLANIFNVPKRLRERVKYLIGGKSLG